MARGMLSQTVISVIVILLSVIIIGTVLTVLLNEYDWFKVGNWVSSIMGRIS